MEIGESKGSGEPLNWKDIERMKYSWNVALEVMRLVPPAQGTFREATSHFAYVGYTITKGCKIYWTVSSTKKDPEIFPESERSDPTRFEGEIPPFLNVPFGQMLIYLHHHHAVTLFKWQLINVNSKVPPSMNSIPSDGVWVCSSLLPNRVYHHD